MSGLGILAALAGGVVLVGLLTRDQKPKKAEKDVKSEPAEKTQPPRDVFVVHGRNNEAKQAVARFLEKLDLHPVILHEQSSSGHTIIEKFEVHSKVPFAVVLMTADDVASPADDPDHKEKRARQNVVLEMGFFMAKLDRKNIVVLKEKSVKVPSDISGIVFIDYDPNEGWQKKLWKELTSAGFQVDLNKAS